MLFFSLILNWNSAPLITQVERLRSTQHLQPWCYGIFNGSSAARTKRHYVRKHFRLIRVGDVRITWRGCLTLCTSSVPSQSTVRTRVFFGGVSPTKSNHLLGVGNSSYWNLQLRRGGGLRSRFSAPIFSQVTTGTPKLAAIEHTKASLWTFWRSARKIYYGKVELLESEVGISEAPPPTRDEEEMMEVSNLVDIWTLELFTEIHGRWPRRLLLAFFEKTTWPRLHFTGNCRGDLEVSSRMRKRPDEK